MSVDVALTYYAAHPDEVKQVMGVYCQAMATGGAVARIVSKTLSEQL
jgi:cyanate permease